jgi:parallel beta-helix repeat protein
VEENEIRFNHGQGVRVTSGAIVRDNYLHHNGQFGIAGSGENILVEGNEIFANGTVGYSPLWAAGGSKFVRTVGLSVKDNFVHDNAGPGLWTDGYNDDALFEGNRVYNNAHAGIKHEISLSATIIDNEIVGNGYAHNVDFRGAGILVRESSSVTISGNVFRANAHELALVQDDNRQSSGPTRLSDIKVISNYFEPYGGRIGYAGDVDDPTSIQFENNQYVVYQDERVFRLGSDDFTYAEWVESGFDVEGTRLDPVT